MQALERFHLALQGAQYAHGSVRTYMSIATRFANFCQKEDGFTPEDALKFQAQMQKAKGNYVQLVHHVLRQFFQAQGQTFNVKLVRKVRSSEVFRPTLEQETVFDLVELAKSNCEAKHLALLAVATVYGLRREELASLTEENFSEGCLGFQAAKGGEFRKHTVPACVQGYMQQYDWPGMSNWQAGQEFKSLCEEAGYPVEKGYNWHSVRRGLITGLRLARTDEIAIQHFMGWRRPQYAELTMQSIYTNWTYQQVDEIIFEKHPFLAAWSNSRLSA